LASAPDRGLDAQPVPAPDRGLDGLAVKRLECGAGDAGVARPGGSSTSESGGEIDNELLKTEATWPALQPADDGARRRHRHQERKSILMLPGLTGESRDRSRGLPLLIQYTLMYVPCK
jgi:hypothetical protein